MSDNGGDEVTKELLKSHSDLQEILETLLDKLDSYEKIGLKIIGYIKLIFIYAIISRLDSLDNDTIQRIISLLQ